MTTTPRTHHRAPDRIPASAVAAGAQDIDEYNDDERSDLQEADVASSTADGNDVGRESGELYGQGIAPTGDIDADGVRGIQDDIGDDVGQHWLETLETQAAENGPAGVADLDDVHGTEADPRPDPDRPVADHGAGGPSGL